MNSVYKISVMLLVLFCACNSKVYVNGRFDHRESGFVSKRDSLNNLCIVIDPGDSIPMGASRVCETDVKLSFFYPVLHTFSAFRSLLQKQALRFGGNVIQFGQYVPVTKGLVRIKGTVYLLNQEAFDRYKQRERDRAETNEKYCIVHIKNLVASKKGAISLLLDDSLIAELPVNSVAEDDKLQKISFNIAPPEAQTYTFKWTFNVKLFAKAVLNKGEKVYVEIELEKGKEYYLYLTYDTLPERDGDGDASGPPALKFVKYYKGIYLSPF